jgi:uncharacterized protein YcfL
MKKNKVLIAAGMMSAMVLLAGCSTNCVISSYAPYQPSETQKLGSTFSTKVLVSNTGGMVVNGLTNGRTMITNNTDDAQTVRYHFVWSSPDGSPQGENTPWTPLVLSPNMTQVVQGVAPNAQATNFQIQVCR